MTRPGDHQPDDAAPIPICGCGGSASRRLESDVADLRRRPSTWWQTACAVLGILFVLVGAIVSTALAISSRASRGDVESLDARLRKVESTAERISESLIYLRASTDGIAAKLERLAERNSQ